MKRPTPKQLALLEYLCDYQDTRHKPPTLREICDHFQWTSLNSPNSHLTALERKGCIRRVRGESRGIEILKRSASFSKEADAVK